MYPRDTLLRIVALALLLYSLLSLSTAASELRRAEGAVETGRAELELLEEENLLRREKLESGLSREELISLARQRLGLVLPGEKIFYFTTDREGQ